MGGLMSGWDTHHPDYLNHANQADSFTRKD